MRLLLFCPRYYAAFPALSDSNEAPKPTTANEDTACVWPNVGHLSPLSSVNQKPEASNKNNNQPSQNSSQVKKEKPKSLVTHHQEQTLTGSSTKKSMTIKGIRVTASGEDGGYQRQVRGGSQFFRCGSQERIIKKSPKISRKKSWPDFERYPQPPFVVPKMVMQSKPPIMGPQGSTDGSTKPGSCRISLQEIFGTDQVREVVPCKTLVVDGQLVRLCATSVNSNNLGKTANVKLHEAPMEELVALRLQQEFQMLNKEVQHEQKMAKNVEVTWYTEPVGHQVLKSPQLRPPLFRSNPSDHSLAETDANHTSSLSATPVCMTLWEDVLDENGVYMGAKLSEPCTMPEAMNKSDPDDMENGASSLDSDYVDMTVASHLLHDLFDDACENDSRNEGTDQEDCNLVYEEAGAENSADQKKPDVSCKQVEPDHKEVSVSQQAGGAQYEETFGDTLNILKTMPNDVQNTISCADCGHSADLQLLHNVSPAMAGKQTCFISQYKGCLMPEITQNKVPDDRPVFFVGEHELNNNHSEHTKVAMAEQWPPVDKCNTDIMYNLFPSLHTSLLSTSSVLVPGYSSVWSVCNNDTSLCIGDAKHFAQSTQNKENIQVSRCVFTVASQNSYCSIKYGTVPMTTSLLYHQHRHSAVWQNDIWGDTLMVSPHKLWDINNMKSVDAAVDTLNEMSDNYFFNLGSDHEAKSNKTDVEFIEGGLYGGTLNSDDAWSTTRSDCSDDEAVCDVDLTWRNMIQSNSTVELGTWLWNKGGSKLSGSMELLPSETSAFSSEALPPRLPHVQSEPSISQRQLVSKASTMKHRLVQVKHLYKPDTSILKTLGLDSDNEEDYKSDGMKYSPNCHFRPIKTPLNQAASGQQVVSIDDGYVYNDFITTAAAKKDEDDTSTLTGSLAEECGLMSSSSGSDSYQLYHNDETLAVTFVPRFKVFKQHKLIQTGEHEQDDTDKLEQGLSERLLVDMKHVLTIEEEDEELESGSQGDLTMKDLDRSLELATSTYEESSSKAMADDPDTVHSVLSTPTPQTIARLWSDSDGQMEGNDKSDIQDTNSTALPSVNSIWSYNLNEQQSNKSALGNLFELSKDGCGAISSQDFSGKGWLFTECPEDRPSEAKLLAKQCEKEELFAVSRGTSDQYIPDVLIEVCASVSSSGMTPGSLPDILLHDSILSGKNQPSVDGVEKPAEVSKYIVESRSRQDHLADVRDNLNSDSSHCFDGFGEAESRDATTLPNFVMRNSYQLDYLEWNMASDYCMHESADEQEPEWLQYDDNVFSDSAEMVSQVYNNHLVKHNQTIALLAQSANHITFYMICHFPQIFPMDPELPTDQAGGRSGSGSPVPVTNFTNVARPPEVPRSQALYSSDLERSWLQDDDNECESLLVTKDGKQRNGKFVCG